MLSRGVRASAALSMIALLGACATPLQSDRVRASLQGARTVELTQVPFFPQEKYQCGPAALATVLDWGGARLRPEDLVSEVYVPGRKGSFQVEMIAAARRHGFVPYPLTPSFDALISEVTAGHPVLVLQNLGLDWYPKWHYAVVVGFDLARKNVILRSGTRERYVIPSSLFERTWRRAKYWALVIVPPTTVPYTADETSYLEAVVPFETLKLYKPADAAYAAALERWPGSLAAEIGLGNTRRALGDNDGAEAVLRQAILDHPKAAVAYNNLAQVLADQGRYGEALDMVNRALALGGPLTATFEATRAQIQRHTAPAAAPQVIELPP